MNGINGNMDEYNPKSMCVGTQMPPLHVTYIRNGFRLCMDHWAEKVLRVTPHLPSGNTTRFEEDERVKCRTYGSI